jgi:hypothetical protein
VTKIRDKTGSKVTRLGLEGDRLALGDKQVWDDRLESG